MEAFVDQLAVVLIVFAQMDTMVQIVSIEY
jgi:hypothetical protein